MAGGQSPPVPGAFSMRTWHNYPVAPGSYTGPHEQCVEVRALGQFSISVEGRSVGPWPRPTAKRLCQLVLLSPGRSITRDLGCEELFPKLAPGVAVRALSKALSMARQALSHLGEPAASMLEADAANIWAKGEVPVSIDVEHHEAALKEALDIGPGQRRDDQLMAALAEQGVFLADEPYLDWPCRRGKGSRHCASRLVWPSPETEAVGLEEPARPTSSGPGKPVSRRTQRVKTQRLR